MKFPCWSKRGMRFLGYDMYDVRNIPDWSMQNEKLLDQGMVAGMMSPTWDMQQQHTGHSGDHCCSHLHCYSDYPGQPFPAILLLTQVREGVGVKVGGGSWHPGNCHRSPLGWWAPGGAERRAALGASHLPSTHCSHSLIQWTHWSWLRRGRDALITDTARDFFS